MKSLTAVRKKSPNYPVEFKIKMVELSHRPEISVAQLAREHGINDNLLFKWRQYWREGKLRPPSTTENNVPELLPITLDAEDVVPTTSPRSQPVAAATPESHCCGQLKLATALEFFQYRFSDSFGGNPPLYSCGL